MRTNASRTRSPVTLRDMSPYSGSFVLIMSSSLADKELDEGVVELIVVLIICAAVECVMVAETMLRVKERPSSSSGSNLLTAINDEQKVWLSRAELNKRRNY